MDFTAREFDAVVLFFFQFGGLVFLAAAFFLVIYSKYSEWEVSVKDGISGYAEEIYEYLDKMFKRRPVRDCYLAILGSTVLFGIFGFLFGLTFNVMGALLGMLIFAFVGFKMPGIAVKYVFQNRVEKFDEQLIDALSMMANAIKSGLSFMQVIQLLEKELPKPASEEFAMVLKENQVGVNLNDALLNMTKRMPSLDLFMIVNSVVTLSQQGGDLSEAFETISFTIRERQRVQEKIKTMSAQGISQAVVLCSLPFVMMGLFYMMQPDYMMLLFTSALGQAMLGAMVILIILGALWIKKILTIEI